MITAESSAVIQRTPQEILDFVMDVASYRRADHKIGRVWSVRREDNNVIASFVGQLRGLPVPTTQRMHLTPGKRIDVSIVPNWQRRMLGFHGSFECQPVLSGTEVTYRYTFDLKGPIRLLEPYLRRWLQTDIPAEVQRMKAILEKSEHLSRRAHVHVDYLSTA